MKVYYTKLWQKDCSLLWMLGHIALLIRAEGTVPVIMRPLLIIFLISFDRKCIVISVLST